MERPIVDFETDEQGDWVALLNCGHRQHVRHRPPFFNREWVLTEKARRAKIGQSLDCAACERFEMPTHYVCYRATLEFTEESVPKGLLREHTTAAGIWVKIEVLEGVLIYSAAACSWRLEPGRPGTIAPGVLHDVQPAGAVRFRLDFYRQPARCRW